ncbi:MAG: hypothetical protein ABI743_15305, partial [bacterium]
MRTWWPFLAALLATACGTTTPATPPVRLPAAPVSMPSDVGLLGLYRGMLDPANATLSLAPDRSAALTDVLDRVDITNFLTLAPCLDCVRVDAIRRVDANTLGVTIGIRHPFDAGDSSAPITAKN